METKRSFAKTGWGQAYGRLSKPPRFAGGAFTHISEADKQSREKTLTERLTNSVLFLFLVVVVLLFF